MRRVEGRLLEERFPINQASHAGHAIHRLLFQKEQGNETDQKKKLEAIIALPLSDVYVSAFQQWQAQVENYTKGTADREQEQFKDIVAEHLTANIKLTATTKSPLAIGLANASPYEIGLTLHQTYGVPYLPGTALKGLARRAALQQGMTESDEAIKVLFGNFKSAGYVTFWDGWLDASCEQPLQLDTITVHHPDYYQGGNAWPTDFDDPIPNSFLSVRPGVTFHLMLSAPMAWAILAAQLLEYGLTYLGLGGKTNAGYGGFRVEREKSKIELETEKRQEEEARTRRIYQDRVEMYEARIASAKGNTVKNVVNDILNQSKDLPPALRRNLLERLHTKLETLREPKLIRRVKEVLEEVS